MESGTSSPEFPQSDTWEAFPQKNLEPGDIVVLVLYFLFVLAVGLWVSQVEASSGGRKCVARSPE
jgi:sodium/myo-inositol cotransporter 11